MEPIGVGVVGCGVMGPRHAQAAQELPLTELVAIADAIAERAQATAERFGVEKIYREGAELCADPDIELVVLALPTFVRTELALGAFANGKHVLTEKPVAMNAAEVEQLIAARGDLTAACCSSRFRFTHGAELAADLIAEGALGELRTIYCRSFFAAGPPPDGPRPEWRLKRHLNGGGFLMNWGCYDLDYLLGITGWQLKPQTVLAQTWTIPPQLASHIPEGSDAETHYAALIRCQGGTMISIERGEYMAAGEETAWQIVGTKGSLHLQMTPAASNQLVFDECTTEQGTASRVLWEGKEDSSVTMWGPLTDLVEAIRDNREPMTSLEQALIVQQITDAIYASAATGEAVSI